MDLSNRFLLFLVFIEAIDKKYKEGLCKYPLYLFLLLCLLAGCLIY
jgi:hypothetical protein